VAAAFATIFARAASAGAGQWDHVASTLAERFPPAADLRPWRVSRLIVLASFEIRPSRCALYHGGYSAPMTLKSWLTKTWCGQLTPM
jgi:hypothetical protein